MMTKSQKGKQIAKNSEIKFNGQSWIVPSQNGNGEYQVNLQLQTCTCLDFDKNKNKCKHQFAVEDKIWGDVKLLESSNKMKAIRQTPRKKRNWAGYDKAQTKERKRFLELLYELCQLIPEPPKEGRGRKPIPLSDILFSIFLKIYERNSSRRTISYINEAILGGYIKTEPHYNSICNYLRKDWLTEILTDLVTISSLPLKSIETSFSVDSSGFSSSAKEKWYDVKYGNNENWHTWQKAHIICGNLTKVVVAVDITAAYGNDSPHFVGLVEKTSRNFKVKEVLADAAYSSKENLEFAVDKQKANVYIPFKSNAIERKDSEIWNKLLRFYQFNQTEFHEKYKYRSNVETAFSAIKLKFDENLRCLSETGQINELLAKIVCHNLSVLVRSTYELGIELESWQDSIQKRENQLPNQTQLKQLNP
jgi:transposase